MKKTLTLMCALLMMAALPSSAITPKEVKPVKNVIVMISDGTSLATISLARWMQFYMDRSKPKLCIDPYLSGTVRTTDSDTPIGDSAPTGSCYVTGVPSRVGYVATYPSDKGEHNIFPVDPKRSYEPCATLLEAAKQEFGKSTGLVVRCTFPHATPADNSAHYYNRGAMNILAEQQVHNNIDVVIAGGNRYLSEANATFLKEHGYSVLRNDIEGMRSCKNNKMWALFGDYDMNYDIDRDPAKQPSLAETVEIALNKLSKNPKGFFMMIEGSLVDYAAHANDPAAVWSEFQAFDAACGVALDFAKKDGNTAIVILADHGNSGLSIGSSRFRNYSNRPMDDLFGPISKFKTSCVGLERKLNSMPYDSVQSIFRQYAGFELTPEELTQLANQKGYRNSPIPEELRKAQPLEIPLYTSGFSGWLGGLLTQHTGLAWTTSGHTGEDVFLASYHPKGTRPMGMHTNVEIAHYLQACFGMYGKMQTFSDRIFARHTEVFEGMECTITKSEDKNVFPTLTVTNPANGKSLSIKAFTNQLHILSKASDRLVELPSVVTYVDRTDKFYLPKTLRAYLK